MRDLEQRLSNAFKLIEELNEKLRRCSGGTGHGSIAQLLQVRPLNAHYITHRRSLSWQALAPKPSGMACIVKCLQKYMKICLCA